MRLTKLAYPVAATALVLVAQPGLAQAAPADRDGDGMADRWETRNGVSNPNGDRDRDRVDNRNEHREGTQPRDRDTDNDGLSDGREDRDRDRLSNAAEDATGNDPRDRDTDNDGIPDGKERAGVVTAYEDGVLTIDLANGGQVSAAVTDRTDVDCATEAVAETAAQGVSASHKDRGPDQGGPRIRGGDGAGRAGARGFGCDGNREGPDQVDCPAGTLAVGAKIHEAALRMTESGAEWVEIEVLIPAAS